CLSFCFRLVEHALKIEALGLPVLDQRTLFEKIGLAHNLVQVAVAHLGKKLAHLFRDVEEVVDNVLRRTLEALAQNRVLSGDTNRASVEMTLAHHDTASRNQRSGREAELVGAKKRTDDDIASGLEATIDLKGDAAAQAIQHQRLMRFGKTHFPRAARMLQRGERRSTGAAVIAGDGDVVGARL